MNPPPYKMVFFEVPDLIILLILCQFVNSFIILDIMEIFHFENRPVL